MWSLGGRAAAVRPNSGEPPPGLAREGRGEGLRVLGDRFVGCLEPVVAGGKGRAGGQEHWPPRLAVPARGWGTGGGWVPASCGVAKGGVGEALGGTDRRGRCCSPRGAHGGRRRQ
jgi:hypothetical protein